MPPVGFEHTILAGERPQTYALDGAATGTGTNLFREFNFQRINRPIIPLLYMKLGLTLTIFYTRDLSHLIYSRNKITLI